MASSISSSSRMAVKARCEELLDGIAQNIGEDKDVDIYLINLVDQLICASRNENPFVLNAFQAREFHALNPVLSTYIAKLSTLIHQNSLYEMASKISELRDAIAIGLTAKKKTFVESDPSRAFNAIKKNRKKLYLIDDTLKENKVFFRSLLKDLKIPLDVLKSAASLSVCEFLDQLVTVCNQPERLRTLEEAKNPEFILHCIHFNYKVIEWVDEGLKDNTKFIMSCLKINAFTLLGASTRIQNSPQFLVFALRCCRDDASREIFIQSAIKPNYRDPIRICFRVSCDPANREIVRTACQNFPYSILFADQSLRSDYEFMASLIETSASILSALGPNLQNHFKLHLKGLKTFLSNPHHNLEYFDRFLKYVMQDPMKDLLRNLLPWVASRALFNPPMSDDQMISCLKNAVRYHPESVSILNPARINPEIFRQLLNINPQCIEFFGRDFFDKQEFRIEILKFSPQTFQRLSDKFKKDRRALPLEDKINLGHSN